MRISTPRPTSLLFRSSDPNDSQRISFPFFRSEIDRIKITYGEIIRKHCLPRCLSLDAGSKFQIQIDIVPQSRVLSEKKRRDRRARTEIRIWLFHFTFSGSVRRLRKKVNRKCVNGEKTSSENHHGSRYTAWNDAMWIRPFLGTYSAIE